ncbi:MAG TPA: chromosome segregation protein SMC, partial [Candidatus Sumerlaeota bacterium]|nr:chromosome segregation protein SMC [Candidatus Sumerlaeota bacterium]
MFLKRVELIGFKSFAAKTAVDFLPGVTVIVGPNGCGKSNIFDAIRWVLGEQSAKSLRGTRMGDVIFAGSSSYKALSYAQVTLVISNDDRRVPVDFTEITVTRRLFNNGESEYLLNRVPCRLRDIMELFMDTGVGMDAYSFMGQGRVDQIISAKPIERRGIFEEAAGISKYKSRKDEALRKLIRTEEDLVRLADIIEEVRKNAASLKRQAAKAERYRELMSRQRDIEKNLLVLRGKNLIESSSGLEKELAGVETRHVELSARLARLNSKNEEERTQSDSISRDLAQDQDLAFAIKSDINRHQGNIKLLQERSANADETTANLKRDLEQDKGRASQLDQSIKEMEHESRDALATLRQVEKQYTDKKAAFETLKNTRLSRLHLLEEKRVVRADSLSKKSRLVNETRYAESMHERVLAQIREQETTLSDNRKSLAEITGLLEERRSSLKSCDSDISLRQEQKQKDLESFREFESRLNQARTDQEALVRRLREAESRLQVMRELKENFEGFQSGVKTVLKASGGGQIPGLGQPVATRINPPEKYEQAIEAALGAALQAILADSADHVEPALALLRDKKAGQASFLALDLCRFEDTNGRLKTLLASKGVLGLARNLVDVDEDHRSVVNALLGDTVIVDALPTAIRLFREGRRERFVTLQGECLDSRGMISGGSAQKTGILSRERDVRKLQELTVTLQKEYTRTEENLGELRRKREERRNALAALDQAIHALQVDRASLAKEVESVQKRRQELADILTAHEKRISQQRSELEKFQETIRKNGEVTARLDEVINALEKEIDTLLAEIDSQKDQETTLDGDVSSLLVEQTTRRERVQALQQRLDAAKGQAQAVQAAIASRLGEIESIAGRKKETAAAIHDTERELQGLIRKRDEIEKRISLRTQEKETLAVEIKKLGGE